MHLYNRYACTLLTGALLTLSVGCSADGSYDYNNSSFDNSAGGFNNTIPANNTTPANNGEPFIPELEEDFEFSQPAVVGDEVFIANETLNSVAIIDSTSLSIRTLPVGFRPTEIVGPGEDPGDGARVMVLNEGSDSVSVIDPVTRAVETTPIMPGANRLRANNTGTAAIAWFDDSIVEDGDQSGDLSSVTLVRDGRAHEVAVGFHVRRVQWTEDGARALILSDDGVSILAIADTDSDRVVPPTPVLPVDLLPLDPSDLEVQIDRDGAWSVARLASFKGVVLTDLSTGAHSIVHLPEIPTDIDLADGDTLEVLIMLRNNHALVRATIPEGVIAASEATRPQPVEPPGADMGLEDMSSSDMPNTQDMGGGDPDMGEDMNLADMNLADMSSDMPGSEDMSGVGADMSLDMGSQDMQGDLDMTSEEDMNLADMSPEDMSLDMATEPGPEFVLDVEGVEVVPLDAALSLGAAAVSGTGTQVLIYTTLGEQRRAILYDMRDSSKRPLRFEKGLKAVIPDTAGGTFVVFHTRVEGEPPVGQSPSDPVFISRSWGLSVVDVASASPRLVLTEHEPWVATRWTVEGQDPRVFVIFKRPVDESFQLPSHRDVLGINLFTFGVDSFRVPSLPEGVGTIPSGRRVYINQKHPQGRMTFVDVVTDSRQTVTGYQLNSGID